MGTAFTVRGRADCKIDIIGLIAVERCDGIMDSFESIIEAAIIAVDNSQSNDLHNCLLTCECEASAKKATSIIFIMCYI